MNSKAILIAFGVSLLCVGALAFFYKREQPEPDEVGGESPDYPNNGMTPKQKNFSLSEFNCHDGTPVPLKYYGNVQMLMDSLQALRDDTGLPVIVISGYRTEIHNRSVGGVTNSQHLQAAAADIKIPGWSPAKVQARILKLIAEGKMTEGGIGSYSTFTHYDVRGYAARWNG